MKSSIRFREERGPLLKAKFPFRLGPIPLSSGIAVGGSEDLAVHIRTSFSAGPALKFAFKPNDLNPLSVILKAGLGLWGSPSDGSGLTLTAEFQLMPKGRGPLFSLRVKPRAGDFCIRNDMNLSDIFPSQLQAASLTRAPVKWNENGEQSNSTTPHKTENATGFDSKPVNKRDKEDSVSLDSNSVIFGSNVSMKIEEFDKDWKSKTDRKKKPEEIKEQDAESEVSTIDDARTKVDNQKSLFLNSVHSSLQTCRINAYSSLPLGRRAKFDIRWGIKPPAEMFQGHDGVLLPSLLLSQLPTLFLEKISLETSAPIKEKRETKPHVAYSRYLDQTLMHSNLLEENQELAQVAAMCYSMKRQLHLMHAENQVLRRAMEDMKSQVEFRGSWNNDATFQNKHQNNSRPPTSKSTPIDVKVTHNSRQDSQQEVEARNKKKETPQKASDFDIKLASSTGPDADVSEFEKAIMNAKASPVVAKKN